MVKPSNIGMTGAWVSGGIEWSIPYHHRASTYRPSDYTTTVNDDGSKTIWVGEYEPRHGMRWTIGVTMFPGKSYFKTEGRMYNSTPYTHTFLYWANVAAHTNNNYQTIFPPSAQIATFHSKSMIEHANDELQGEETVEAGVIFGASEADNVRKSLYYTIRGLGNKGLDKTNKAEEDLQKAVDLSRSNLWAKVELVNQ